MRCPACVSAVIGLSLVLIVAASATPASAAVLRTYFTGNSMTDGINYGGLTAVAQSRSHTLTWGKHVATGSTIYGIWSRPTTGFNQTPFGYYGNAFANYDWDNLVVTPTDRKLYVQFNGIEEGDVPSSLSLLGAARNRSPNVQLYVYSRTPRRVQNSDGTFQPMDYKASWLRKYSNSAADSWDSRWGRDYVRQLVSEIDRTKPEGAKSPLLVPVGEVFYELERRIRAGVMPGGYTDVGQFFVDASHYNSVGSYAAAVTFYSVMYKDSPLGLGVPSQFGNIPADVAGAIRASVWEVVRREPQSPLYVPVGRKWTDDMPVSVTYDMLIAGVVPEPGTLGVLALGGTALLRRRRRAA
jgi:hypothetical protein